NVGQRHAQRVCGDLSQNGVCSGPDICGCSGHFQMAVARECCTRTCFLLEWLPDAGGDAPADPFPAVAHAAWFIGASSPAGTLVALCLAVAQGLRAGPPVL